MLTGEIWDDSECCDWTIEDRAVKLRDDVGATLVLRYDDERTEISRSHFAIERFLDSSIPDEDEVAEFEVVLDNGGGMLLFETDHSLNSSGVDVGGECCQVSTSERSLHGPQLTILSTLEGSGTRDRKSVV